MIVVFCWTIFPRFIEPLGDILPLLTMMFGVGIFVFTIGWISDIEYSLRGLENPFDR